MGRKDVEDWAEEETMPTGNKGKWDMDAIKQVIKDIAENCDVTTIRSKPLDAFIEEMHPSGTVKYRGYYAKKKINEAFGELKDEGIEGIGGASEAKDKVFIKIIK